MLTADRRAYVTAARCMRHSSQPHRHSGSDHAHNCIIQDNSRAAVALYRTILNASPPTQPAYGVPEKLTMSYLLHDKLQLLASQPRRTGLGIGCSKSPMIMETLLSSSRKPFYWMCRLSNLCVVPVRLSQASPSCNAIC